MRSRTTFDALLTVAAASALATALFAPLGGCGHVGASAPPPKVYSPIGDFFDALAEARSARDRAYALSAPSPAELAVAGSNEDAVAVILRRWATARRDATVEAERAYERALRAARGPEEEAETRGELAELWLGVQEDVEIALLAAAPTSYRDDPSLVSYVQLDIVEALRPLRDKVAGHLEKCRFLLRDFPGLGAAMRKCETAGQRLTETGLPHGAPSPTRDAGAGAAMAGGPRTIVPTTYPKPCAFAGSVLVRGAVFAEPTGGAPLQTFDGVTPIEVTSLEASDAPGGRYKVAVSWPYALEGYLESAEPPFVLKRQVDVVVTHVWLEKGARVSAVEARGPTARALRDLVSPPAPAEVAGAAAPKIPTILRADRRIFCRDLELAASPSMPPEAGGPLVKLKLDAAGVVPLFRASGGREVARVPASEAHIVERKGAFAHVAGTVPLSFDGWIRASSLLLAEAPAPR